MALQPGNTSFVPGDLLTAQQYNITHNTVNKLAIEDNSRVVYPGSFPPANIASGHWVIAALAGNYSNYPGITSTSVLSPSVLVYDSSINEWDVYPLTGTNDSTIGIYNPSVQYKVNDIVIYNDIDSVLPEYRHEYIYRCNEIAFPDQSPESNPSKWVRQGLYIDTDAITALITSLDSRLTSVEIELTNKVNTSLLGANNGVATLDDQGKILTSQLPSLLINNTYVVNSEVEMLALLATKSDIAVRTDIEKTFILAEEPASNINNWIEVLASYDRVISVNGLGGIVTLTTSNIPEGSNLYFSDLRVNNNTNVAANTAKRHDQVTIGTPNGLSLNGQELSLQKASITETGALSSEDWLTFNNKQDIILQGPVGSYYRGDKTWQTLNTASVLETTNLYFTQSRVLNTSIGNFIEIDVAITAGDSIATALNKLQTQVNNRIATVSKEQIEAVLTGNITSHTHSIYLTDAPVDNKQYARKDGSWVEVEGGGEANTASSVGTGESVYKEKVGVDLRFKSIKAGNNVSVVSNANEVVISSTGGGTIAMDAVPTAGSTNAVQSGGVKTELDKRSLKITTPTANRLLKSGADGNPVEASFRDDQVVQVGSITMNDINVGEKKIMVVEKQPDGSAAFGGAIGLLDVIGNPNLSALLAETAAGWAGDEITLTGDNRSGELGENSQFYELESDFFLCKSHYNGTTSTNGWAVWRRNRGTDCLISTITAHAAIIAQLEIETGWSIAQFKQITAKSKRGTWFRRPEGGYLYMCINDANGWTRIGTPPTVTLEITSLSHPNLTASLIANDFATSPFYLEKTNATDETASQGQEWWDTTNKKAYKRNMDGYWLKMN